MTSEGGGEEQLMAAVSMVPSSAQSVHLDLNLGVSGTSLTLELGGTESPPRPPVLVLGIKLRFLSLYKYFASLSFFLYYYL